MLKKAADAAKSTPEELHHKIENLSDEIKLLKKDIEQLNSKLLRSSLDSIIADAQEVKGFKVVAAKMGDMDMNALRNASDSIKDKLGSGVVILASSKDQKVNLIVSATPDAVSSGVHSGQIIKEAAAACGGGGGGRPDMAQAGGKNPAGIDEALKIARQKAADMIK